MLYDTVVRVFDLLARFPSVYCCPVLADPHPRYGTWHAPLGSALLCDHGGNQEEPTPPVSLQAGDIKILVMLEMYGRHSPLDHMSYLMDVPTNLFCLLLNCWWFSRNGQMVSLGGGVNNISRHTITVKADARRGGGLASTRTLARSGGHSSPFVHQMYRI